jgi:phosphatidylglycerol:prolipoprotein diacylglycerol transferase
MFPYLRLGPFLLQMPLLALLVGLWIGLTFVERESIHQGLKKEVINNLVFYGLIGGIVFARLGYAAQYASVYLSNPFSLLSLNTNTFLPSAGLVFGTLIAIGYGYRQKLPFRKTLDVLAPGLAFFMIMLGVSHLLNGNAYGSTTNVPWSIYLWSEYRQPTQIYEIFLALVIFTVVFMHMIPTSKPGSQFIQFIALSATARLFIEGFRGDSATLLDGYRTAQVVSLFILIVCIYLFRNWEDRSEHEPSLQ